MKVKLLLRSLGKEAAVLSVYLLKQHLLSAYCVKGSSDGHKCDKTKVVSLLNEGSIKFFKKVIMRNDLIKVEKN